MSAHLIVCRGAREIVREELLSLGEPSPRGRWHPCSHARLADAAQEAMELGGYVVRSRRYSVDKTSHRFIGVGGETLFVVDYPAMDVDAVRGGRFSSVQS